MKSLFVLLLAVGISAQAGNIRNSKNAINADRLATKKSDVSIREIFNSAGDVAGKVKHYCDGCAPNCKPDCSNGTIKDLPRPSVQ